MKKVRCPYCGFFCTKYGKNYTGKQRWQCKSCYSVFVQSNDTTAQDLKCFLAWLFSKETHKEMVGAGRSFRRKTKKFWKIWPMPPKVEQSFPVLYVDGIYLARKACVLICCSDAHVLGWYVCRSENSRAWEALLSRIAQPTVVISDGGTGFRKALKKVWPKTRLQRCVFHAFCQVRRYTTTRSKSLAGAELYDLARELLHIKDSDQAIQWTVNLQSWHGKHKAFLNELTREPNGNFRSTHERLLKAEKSLINLIKSDTLFTYLKPFDFVCPSTNNRIEGAINAQIRAMLRNHRGMSIERRIKAVFWWCYMHTEKPLSPREILKVMPTDRSISTIYNTMNARARLEKSIPTWGDAIVWNELHHSDPYPTHLWD